MSFLAISVAGWTQIGVLLALLTILVRPVGLYIARVMNGQTCFLTPFVRPAEKIIYAVCGIDPYASMKATEYLKSLLYFSLLGFVFLFLFLMTQSFPHISPDLAFNAAISFVTNTNWQSFTPETTISMTRQMFGFTVQNFVSSAAGLCVLAAMARGFGAPQAGGVGNFWADMTRSILYILLPLSFVLALFLISQGVVQTFEDNVAYQTIEAKVRAFMSIGPVASQAAIKQIGTNGGGYFAANAAHPFENPTPLTNFIQILAMLLIPASLTLAFDNLMGRKAHGWSLYWIMLALFVPLTIALVSVEQAGNPLLKPYGIDAALGNMEGKEMRFGVVGSALWAAATTATSTGSLNASLDSFMPLGGLVPIAFLHLGEVVFGGVGSGLYGIAVYILLTSFLAGLMVGRTPEYCGKKIGVFEMKLVALVIILQAFMTLVGTAVAVLVSGATTAPAYQGLSQMLYAFSSASMNNGSAFGGIQADTVFMNMALGLCMAVGRFGVIACLLHIAGAMAEKTPAPVNAGTFRTDTMLFLGLLLGVIVIVSILTFVPSWALGPVAEHMYMLDMRGMTR